MTKQKKGNQRPINPQKQRALIVDSLKDVDYTYLDQSQSRQEYLELLNLLKPTIIAITEENKTKKEAYSNFNWTLKEFPDKNQKEYSTTNIINKIIKNKHD